MTSERLIYRPSRRNTRAAGFDADGKDEQHEGDVARTTGESEAKLAKQQSGKQHP